MKKLQIALSLAAFILYSTAVYKMGTKNEKMLCTASIATLVSDAATARANLVEEYRKKEKALTDKIALIETAHLKDKKDEKAEADRLIAGYRNDVYRLRKRFTSDACGVSDVSRSATAPGQRDGASTFGLQDADVEFLIRFASGADQVADTLRACQAVLTK